LPNEYLTPDAFQKNLDENYIDLSKVFAHVSSYADWEGFADPVPIRQAVKDAMSRIYPDYTIDYSTKSMTKVPLEGSEAETRTVVETLALHWAYENADQAEALSIEQIADAIGLIQHLLSCRWWMKETAE